MLWEQAAADSKHIQKSKQVLPGSFIGSVILIIYLFLRKFFQNSTLALINCAKITIKHKKDYTLYFAAYSAANNIQNYKVIGYMEENKTLCKILDT